MMVHKSLLVLLAIGSLSAVESLVTSNFSSSELLFQQDDYSHLGLSLEQVKRIMLTEVNEEFGERRLTNADSEALWSNAVKYEWSLAEEREEKAQQEGRRTQEGTLQLGASPFVVCDMHFGKTGESCKATVESYLGSHLIVSPSRFTRHHFALHSSSFPSYTLPSPLVCLSRSTTKLI